jgi:small subunit ribosomal protein S8
MRAAIAGILKAEGYIADYEVVEAEGRIPTLRVELKYVNEREPVISQLKRISKPGRRVYTRRSDIPWVLSGMGVAIITTPRGVMTDRQARRENVGGEVLCYVW